MVDEEIHALAGIGVWEADVATWTSRWSPVLRRLVGLADGEPAPGIDGYLGRVHLDDQPQVKAAMIALLRAGTPFQLEHRLVRNDGSIARVDARGSARAGREGRTTTVFGTVQELKAAPLERALEQAEALNRTIGRNVPNGLVLVVDRDLRCTFAEGDLEQLAGDAARLVGRTFEEAGWPEDRATLETCAREALRGQPQHVEVSASGHELEATLAPVADRDGTIFAVAAILSDVTAGRKTWRALRRQTGFAMIHAGVAVAANEAKTFREALPTCINLICTHGDWTLGHAYVPSLERGDELLPSGCWNATADHDFAAFKAATMALPYSAGQGLVGGVLRDKQPVWIEDLAAEDGFLRAEAAAGDGLRSVLFFPVVADGYLAAVLELFSTTARPRDDELLLMMDIVTVQLTRLVGRERDRTRLIEDAEAMRSLSLVDELTGLQNRRGFLDLGGEVLRRAHAEQRRAFLVFVDLDGMKQINDRLGHEVGDQALVETAAILRRGFRGTDVIARLGGDEFVVLAAERANVDPTVFADRIRAIVGTENERPGRTFELQLSIGIEASDPARLEPLEALLARADRRMYEEKRTRKAQQR